MNEERTCKVCSAVFACLHKNRAGLFCSKKCEGVASTSLPNLTCQECGTLFYRKPSRLNKQSKHGICCSISCSAIARSRATKGSSNPNYKGRTTDDDGYLKCVPESAGFKKYAGTKLHIAVSCEQIGVESIPAGYHVHHRDCNRLNNRPDNLAVLAIGDHMWLHRQFGIASLWAMCHGKVAASQLVLWSDDHERAERLLSLCITNQTKKTLEIA